MCCVLITTASDLIDFLSSWGYVGPTVVHVSTGVLMLQKANDENA